MESQVLSLLKVCETKCPPQTAKSVEKIRLLLDQAASQLLKLAVGHTLVAIIKFSPILNHVFLMIHATLL